MNDVISVSHLSRSFGSLQAVSDVTFNVSKGCVFGFLGANGAGKTTTIKLMLGLLKPTSGSVRLFGEPIGCSPSPELRRTGVLFENNGVYDRLTVLQNMTFLAEVYRLDKATADRRITELLDWLELDRLSKKQVSSLSTGERRKLGIARALINDPELVVLDEPTLGLDVEASGRLRTLLQQRVREQNLTVFLTTHHLAEVERLCDRVAVLRDGVIVADASPDEIARRSSRPKVTVQARDISPAAISAVKALPGVQEVLAQLDQIVVTYASEPDNAALVKALVACGANVQEVRADHGEFEQSFLDLIR